VSMEQGLKETLRQLVAVDTTSSRSNAPLVDLVEPRLRALGFQCERMNYVDAAGVPKVNLLARYGTFEVARLALVGHTDCVPYDPAWTDALTLTERDGRLYGRGACDTKAFIACALHAVERVRRDGLLVMFTADEEVGCVGARKLVDASTGKARYAIVGEPTSLTPIRAHKGYCLAEVEVRGKEGHSAYPDTGASAIFRAARFLEQLERRSLGELRAVPLQDPAFDPPYTTVNVGLIHGGKAKNVIPGRCRFIVEWRPLPTQDVDHVTRMLEDIVAELRRSDASLEVDIQVHREDRGVDTSPASEVVKFLAAQSGNAPSTVAFGTEAPHLTALGAEAVVFGPGDIKNAHQTGEFVPVEELLRCEAILERALEHFLP
jgi:acetylornithine deacetylase